MFSTTSHAAMNYNLLNEIAGSGAVSDPVLFIYAVLVAFAVGTLMTGYFFFGRSGKRALPGQN